jgi:hypothetical protein
VATSERHDGAASHEARPSASTACWAASPTARIQCYRLSGLCMLAHARLASGPKENDVMASRTKPCAS